MSANVYVIEDYENETAFRPQKNKPNQTQSVFFPSSNEYMFIHKTVKKSCAREGRLIKIDLKHSFLSAVADYGSAFCFFKENRICEIRG
jgi:phosphopantetheine adenylyltransferase